MLVSLCTRPVFTGAAWYAFVVRPFTCYLIGEGWSFVLIEEWFQDFHGLLICTLYCVSKNVHETRPCCVASVGSINSEGVRNQEGGLKRMVLFDLYSIQYSHVHIQYSVC